MKTKLIILTAVFAMFFVAVPSRAAAPANNAPASQTPATEISTAAQLAAINRDAASLRGNYALMNDIIVDDWTPIGSKATPFLGTLEGNQHTITILHFHENPGTSGPRITNASNDLFGETGKGSLIKNLTIYANTESKAGYLFRLFKYSTLDGPPGQYSHILSFGNSGLFKDFILTSIDGINIESSMIKQAVIPPGPHIFAGQFSFAFTATDARGKNSVLVPVIVSGSQEVVCEPGKYYVFDDTDAQKELIARGDLTLNGADAKVHVNITSQMAQMPYGKTILKELNDGNITGYKRDNLDLLKKDAERVRSDLEWSRANSSLIEGTYRTKLGLGKGRMGQVTFKGNTVQLIIYALVADTHYDGTFFLDRDNETMAIHWKSYKVGKIKPRELDVYEIWHYKLNNGVFKIASIDKGANSITVAYLVKGDYYRTAASGGDDIFAPEYPEKNWGPKTCELEVRGARTVEQVRQAILDSLAAQRWKIENETAALIIGSYQGKYPVYVKYDNHHIDVYVNAGKNSKGWAENIRRRLDGKFNEKK